MAGTQAFNELLPVSRAFVFTSADTPGVYKQAVANAILNGRIDSMVAINTDSVAHLVTVQIQDQSGVSCTLGSISVAAGAGNGTIPVADVLAAITVADQKRLLLLAGGYLSMTFATVIAALTSVQVLVQGGLTA